MAGQASASARVVLAFVDLVLEVVQVFASVHLVEASVALAFAFVQAVD